MKKAFQFSKVWKTFHQHNYVASKFLSPCVSIFFFSICEAKLFTFLLLPDKFRSEPFFTFPIFPPWYPFCCLICRGHEETVIWFNSSISKGCTGLCRTGKDLCITHLLHHKNATVLFCSMCAFCSRCCRATTSPSSCFWPLVTWLTTSLRPS